MTAEDLLNIPGGDGFQYELIGGELRKMAAAGHQHGHLAVVVTTSLAQHVYAHNLGRVYAAETGFILERDPDTVRAPDAAFIRKERVDAVGDGRGYWEGPPDLVVEVISPNDRYSEVEETVSAWLEAGTGMVIVVDPRRKRVTVERPTGETLRLTEQNVIEGGDVVPGWSLPVRAIFE
jgi:Uma2 family endonuclease